MTEYADRDYNLGFMQTAGRNPRKLDDALRLSPNLKVYQQERSAGLPPLCERRSVTECERLRRGLSIMASKV